MSDECRLCLKKSVRLLWIFDKNVTKNKNLSEIIYVTTGVEITKDDSISQKICTICYTLVVKMYKFRLISMENQTKLRFKSVRKCLRRNMNLKNLTRENVSILIHPTLQKLIKLHPNLTFPKKLVLHHNFLPRVKLVNINVKKWLNNTTKKKVDNLKLESSVEAKTSVSNQPLSAQEKPDSIQKAVDQSRKPIEENSPNKVIILENIQVAPPNPISPTKSNMLDIETVDNQSDTSSKCSTLILNDYGMRSNEKIDTSLESESEKSNFNHAIARENRTETNPKPIDPETEKNDATAQSRNDTENPANNNRSSPQLNSANSQNADETKSDLNRSTNDQLNVTASPPNEMKDDFIKSLNLVRRNLNETFPKESTELLSSIKKSEKIYTCPYCDSLQNTKKELRLHERAKHSTCKMCKKKCFTPHSLRNHQKIGCKYFMKPSIVLVRAEEIPELRQKYAAAFAFDKNAVEDSLVSAMDVNIRDYEHQKFEFEIQPPVLEPVMLEQPINSPEIFCISDDDDCDQNETMPVLVPHNYDPREEKIDMIHVVTAGRDARRKTRKKLEETKTAIAPTAATNANTVPKIKFTEDDILNTIDFDSNTPISIIKNVMGKLGLNQKSSAANRLSNLCVLPGAGSKMKIFKNLRTELLQYKIPIQINYGANLDVKFVQTTNKSRSSSKSSDSNQRIDTAKSNQNGHDAAYKHPITKIKILRRNASWVTERQSDLNINENSRKAGAAPPNNGLQLAGKSNFSISTSTATQTSQSSGSQLICDSQTRNAIRVKTIRELS